MATVAAINMFAGSIYEQLVALGFWKYVLPWLLAFVLIGAILYTIGLFEPRFTALISFLISVIIVSYTPFQTGQYAAFLSTYFGSISILLVIILGVLLVTGLLGAAGITLTHTWIIGVAVILVLSLAFASGGFYILVPPTVQAQTGGTITSFFFDAATLGFYALLGLVFLAIAWVML